MDIEEGREETLNQYGRTHMLKEGAGLTILSLILLGCGGPVPERAEDTSDPELVREELIQTYRVHVADLLAGDLPAVASIYTSDIIIRRPGGQPLRGSEEVSEFFEMFFGAFSLDSASYTPAEVDVFGDTAWEFGTWMWATRAKEGEGGAVDSGNYLVKWRRQGDGSWKIHRNILNSTQPPQES